MLCVVWCLLRVGCLLCGARFVLCVWLVVAYCCRVLFVLGVVLRVLVGCVCCVLLVVIYCVLCRVCCLICVFVVCKLERIVCCACDGC